MTTVASCLQALSLRLLSHSDTPGLDARLLLAHVLKRSTSWLAAHPEAPIDSPASTALEQSVLCLESGEALPYLLGEWEFFGLPFFVTPVVLIPRPETELLVEHALVFLRSRPAASVLDVGTGSGCIAIALASHLPDISLTATDLSPEAIAVARRNAARHDLSARIDFFQADLFPASLHPAPFDLLVANLPYIPTAALHSLPVHTREPALALDGGPDGLSLIRRLLSDAPRHLAPGARILLEIEASQGGDAHALARSAFPGTRTQVHRDLAGRDRLLEIQT